MNNLKKLFEKKNFDLNEEISKSYIENGVGCFAVKIKKYEDAISFYAGEGYECLNNDFAAYLDGNIRFIPSDVPILLQVYGCKLKEKQKKIIIQSIREHYLYKLGLVIEENKAKRRKISIFIILAAIFFLLTVLTESVSDFLSDFLNLAFWFYGSAVVTYFAVDLKGAIANRRRAGQIAYMYITVEEKLNTAPLTDKYKNLILEFIEEERKKSENAKA